MTYKKQDYPSSRPVTHIWLILCAANSKNRQRILVKFKIISVTGLGLLCASASAQIDFRSEKSTAQIARDAFPSVVLLTMQDEKGQPFKLGSGFFIAEDTVATNFHVIDGAAAGYAKGIGQSAKFSIKGIVGLDALHDLVLLQLEAPLTPPLSVAPKLSVNVGDAVYAIGNPRGLEGTFSQGIVSS